MGAFPSCFVAWTEGHADVVGISDGAATLGSCARARAPPTCATRARPRGGRVPLPLTPHHPPLSSPSRPGHTTRRLPQPPQRSGATASPQSSIPACRRRAARRREGGSEKASPRGRRARLRRRCPMNTCRRELRWRARDGEAVLGSLDAH